MILFLYPCSVGNGSVSEQRHPAVWRAHDMFFHLPACGRSISQIRKKTATLPCGRGLRGERGECQEVRGERRGRKLEGQRTSEGINGQRGAGGRRGRGVILFLHLSFWENPILLFYPSSWHPRPSRPTPQTPRPFFSPFFFPFPSFPHAEQYPLPLLLLLSSHWPLSRAATKPPAHCKRINSLHVAVETQRLPID